MKFVPAKDLVSIVHPGICWHCSLTSMWHALIFLKNMVNEHIYIYIYILYLVSLNENSNPQYLRDLAKWCMFWKLVPPLLIGMYSVVKHMMGDPNIISFLWMRFVVLEKEMYKI